MKTKIVVVAILFASVFSTHVNAQLEVLTSGNVKASKNLEVTGMLTVGGNSRITNNQILGKNSRITDTLTVGDSVRITSDLVSCKNLMAADTLTVGENLTVNQNVAIGTNIDDHVSLNIEHTCDNAGTPITYYGIKSHIKTCSGIPTSPVYSIYGWADGTYSPYLVPSIPLVGVMGVAKKSYTAPSTFAAGIVGLTHYYGGIGVYGGITSSPTSAPSSMASGEKYAGYFGGTTKVNGTLLATMLVLNGDTVNVNNTRSISTDAADGLTQLHPVSYSFKPDSALNCDEKLQREMTGTHYGLIAQDVQKVLPELVYEREGSLSINYIELIPLLIMKVKELSAEVESMKKAQQVK